jgi:hypothetical protein
MMQDPPKHIPLAILWKYSRESATLAEDHFEHLQDCQDCVAITFLCRKSDSLEEVVRTLDRFGISRE